MPKVMITFTEVKKLWIFSDTRQVMRWKLNMERGGILGIRDGMEFQKDVGQLIKDLQEAAVFLGGIWTSL